MFGEGDVPLFPLEPLLYMLLQKFRGDQTHDRIMFLNWGDATLPYQ